mgnify:CR=1 FL=1
MFTKSSLIFFFAVFAAVYFFVRIGQYEDMIQSLLNRSDTTRIFTADHIADFVRKVKTFFRNNLLILDNVDSNVVINETKDVKNP